MSEETEVPTVTTIMDEFSQSNAKIMATALFFEYCAYFVFQVIDSYKKEGPEYIYVNKDLAAINKDKAEKARKAKDEQKKKAQADKANKKEEKKKEQNDKKNKKKEDAKEGGEMEYDGGDKNERGKGPTRKPNEKPNESRRGGQENKPKKADKPDEFEEDYQRWDIKNKNSISKIIVNGFSKYFLFFAFCVGFCASRAPTDFAVGLTYSVVLTRIIHVYAHYYNNEILTIGAVGLGAFINLLLIFTGLIHNY